MVQRQIAFAAILVALVCAVGVLAADAEKHVDEKVTKTEKSIPSKLATVARTARSRTPSKAVVTDTDSKKATRATAESSKGQTPVATTQPAYAVPAPSPSTAFTSTADSPYAHLFHPSAVDLSSFFAPQFQNPGKQEQIDLASFYAQYNTGPQAAYNGAGADISQYLQGDKQSIYNYRQPGAQVFVSQPGHRQPSNGEIVYQSQKPATQQDFNLVYQTIRQQQKGQPVVFPTQKSPVVSNDYSTVYQAQRPNSANIRKPSRPPGKISATYQSQKSPTAAEYASVYQNTASLAPSPSSAPDSASLYSQSQRQPTQQVVYVPQYVPQPVLQHPEQQQQAHVYQQQQQPGTNNVDINKIVSSQVLPQIQQQGGPGIQLLDLSAFYPQQQGGKGAAQPAFYQVTGGKNLAPLQYNPSLYQHLQQSVQQGGPAHADQPSPAAPTLSPEQLEAFYKSIGAQPPPPPSPRPPSGKNASPSPAHPTAPAPVSIPAPAIYSTQASPVAQYGQNPALGAAPVQYVQTPASGPAVHYTTAAGYQQYQNQQQAGVQGPVDLSAYYKALSAAQAQAQVPAPQGAGQHSAQILPAELAAIYRQQAGPAAAVSSAASSGSRRPQHPASNDDAVYVPAGPDPREVYYPGQAVAPQPGYVPHQQAVYYAPQYQQVARPRVPPGSIASLISQLPGSNPTQSPAYFQTSPTSSPAYYSASTPSPVAKRPSRIQQLKQFTASTPELEPTPNPTTSSMPQKTRQLVKKPHNFGHGYSFEIRGR